MGLSPSRGSTAHADQVRQRILEGAARAFAVSGYQGTSVPELAAAVGVSVGLLYRYFPSKADLFTAICVSEMDSELAALSQQLSEIADPRDRLRQGVDYYLRELHRKGGSGLILGALSEAPTSPALREVLRLRRTAIRDFVAGYLGQGIGTGELSDSVPTEHFAEAIAMLLDGALAALAIYGDEVDLPAMRDSVVSLLAAALRRPA